MFVVTEFDCITDYPHHDINLKIRFSGLNQQGFQVTKENIL